jgi:arsenate reductase
MARIFSDTFSGIAPESVLGFVVFQVVGAGLALGLTQLLFAKKP